MSPGVARGFAPVRKRECRSRVAVREARAPLKADPPDPVEVRTSREYESRIDRGCEGSVRLSDRHALILGGAQCVWDDLVALESITGRWRGIVIAVNDIGCVWARRLDHWVSLHPHKFKRWEPKREENGHPGGYVKWGKKEVAIIDRFPEQNRMSGGSSGMLAVAVAREVGCNRIVLCGVPLTKEPHFAESVEHVAGRKWAGATGHWKSWTKRADKLKPYVRSMSGRTRTLLGAPIREWLDE